MLFPPDYIKHDIPVIYNKEEIKLNTAQEEAATLYARYIESDYVKNKIFNKNFWKDWRKTLGDKHQIQNLEGCDFSLIFKHILSTKESQKKMLLETKKERDEIEKNIKRPWLMGRSNPWAILE